MAKNVTPDQLVADAYTYADMVQGANAFVAPTQALRLVNLAAGEFYDLLVAARGHEYYITESTIAVVAGTSRYNLPSDFYELLSLVLNWSSTDNEEVADYSSVRDRPRYQNGLTWVRWGAKAFRLRAAVLELLPVPNTTVTATLQYLPVMPDMVLGGTSFDGVNGWERLITLKAAIDMCTIANRDCSKLQDLFDRERDRVQGMADDRAAEHPAQIRDVYPEIGTGRLDRGF